MEWIDRLAAYWESVGIRNERLPTAPDIEDFERRHAVALPLDLREYFLRLNGTSGGQCALADDELISFWRLDEVATLAAEGVANLKDAGDWFVFADYSIWAHSYAIRLSSDRDAPTPVAICYNPPTFPAAATMSHFVDAYLSRDYSVLFASPPDPLAAPPNLALQRTPATGRAFRGSNAQWSVAGPLSFVVRQRKANRANVGRAHPYRLWRLPHLVSRVHPRNPRPNPRRSAPTGRGAGARTGPIRAGPLGGLEASPHHPVGSSFCTCRRPRAGGPGHAIGRYPVRVFRLLSSAIQTLRHPDAATRTAGRRLISRCSGLAPEVDYAHKVPFLTNKARRPVVHVIAKPARIEAPDRPVTTKGPFLSGPDHKGLTIKPFVAKPAAADPGHGPHSLFSQACWSVAGSVELGRQAAEAKPMAGSRVTEVMTDPPSPEARGGRHTRHLLIGFYSLAIAWGARSIYYWKSSALDLLFPLTFALLLGWWSVTDARRRGRPIPLLTRPWFYLGAGLLVPGYVVWSRRWRGVGWLALHGSLWYALATVVMVVGGLLAFGRGWPRAGGP